MINLMHRIRQDDSGCRYDCVTGIYTHFCDRHSRQNTWETSIEEANRLLTAEKERAATLETALAGATRRCLDKAAGECDFDCPAFGFCDPPEPVHYYRRTLEGKHYV